MGVYAYKGIDARGKSVKGNRDADSAKALRTVLKRDGILATEILEQAEAAKKGTRDIDFGRLFRRVSQMDVAIATRQLSVLLRSGVHSGMIQPELSSVCHRLHIVIGV